MVKKYLIAITLILLLMLASYSIFRNNPKEGILYRQKRVALGTFVEVISTEQEAIDIAFKEIDRVEKLLSKYKPGSEVYILNKKGRVLASPDTFHLIKKAKEFYYLTDGAFDITVGPLMDLWGFTTKEYSRPPEEKIRKVSRLIGSDKIILRPKDNMIQFKLSGMQVDLGAIAKGYAVDCAVKKLKDANIENALVNAGGQVYCLGTRFLKPWKVAIMDNPHNPAKDRYLYLQDKAVSTSGDYGQFFTDNHKVYGHIFDPKTGYPKPADFFSVTVIADDSMTADFLSTAIFVLGEEDGLALASKFKGAQVRIIRK